MEDKKQEISVAVLMGGRSSRMGQDKGLLEYRGKSMVEHVLNVGNSLSKDVFLVGNNKGYGQFGYNVFSDIPVGKGPLKGILTALYHARHAHVLVLGCDMPHYSTDVANKMLSHGSKNVTLIPQINDMYQPLSGLYHTNAYTDVLHQLEKGTYKIMDALEHIEWQPVLFNEGEFPQKSFFNINSKTDLTQQP